MGTSERDEFELICRYWDALLDQRDEWIGEEGRIKLADMAPTHRLHTYRWLIARAQVIEFYASAGEFVFMPEFLQPRGDMATLAFEQAMDEEIDYRANDPVYWLVRTPFMSALRKFVLRDKLSGALNQRMRIQGKVYGSAA